MRYAIWLAILMAASGVVVAGLDVIRRMTPATWHPYRFSMIAVCVGAFGQGLLRWWPDNGSAWADDGTRLLILIGLCGLILFERRSRPPWEGRKTQDG